MTKTTLVIRIDTDLAGVVADIATKTRQRYSDLIERALRSYLSFDSAVNRMHAQLGDQVVSQDQAAALTVSTTKDSRTGEL